MLAMAEFGAISGLRVGGYSTSPGPGPSTQRQRHLEVGAAPFVAADPANDSQSSTAKLTTLKNTAPNLATFCASKGLTGVGL